jgi:predicted small lipoprotein YifL
MNQIIKVFAVIFIVVFTLTACGTNTPSLGQAPSKQLVKKAVTLQVSQTQQQLTQQLQSSPSKFKITKVALKQLEPLFLGGLPTYHFLGTYNIQIGLSEQETQQKNNFDIYIQRQKEGKTWRLLIPDNKDKTTKSKSTWRTYLIPFDT